MQVEYIGDDGGLSIPSMGILRVPRIAHERLKKLLKGGVRGDRILNRAFIIAGRVALSRQQASANLIA